jgi:hypothetical protein
MKALAGFILTFFVIAVAHADTLWVSWESLPVYAQPNPHSKQLGSLARGHKVFTMGDEQNGMIRLSQMGHRAMWVQRNGLIAEEPDLSQSDSDVRHLSDAPAELDNRLFLNIAPVLGSGIGASYERSIAEAVTLGAYINYFKVSTDATADFSTPNQVIMYGVKGRWFFAHPANFSGWYLSGALGGVSVNTQTTYQGSTYPNVSNSATAQTNSFGWEAGVGYQIIAAHLGPRSRLLIDLGLVYGTGYAVETQSTFSSINGATVQAQASDSVFLEASFGLGI